MRKKSLNRIRHRLAKPVLYADADQYVCFDDDDGNAQVCWTLH